MFLLGSITPSRFWSHECSAPTITLCGLDNTRNTIYKAYSSSTAITESDLPFPSLGSGL